MSEREKMLAGELYDCGDPELLDRWHLAKDLICRYNQIKSNDLIEKKKVLSELLGKMGDHCWITPPFYVDYGNNISIGNNCEINMNCTFLDDNKITIGDYALIAPNVQFYTAYHPLSARERFGEMKEDGTFPFCKTLTAPITIGNHVWIGGGSILLPGVSIGDNCVIGAGSVVTHNIPANSIAYGNPCRIIRENNKSKIE
ncbi:MAG: sugar O-acetyltransferase [Erysipelotrichaceae bacterium]